MWYLRISDEYADTRIRACRIAALPNAEPLWPAVRPGRLRPALAADEVHVWSMSLSRPAWPIEELAGWLDADETVRAARFHFEKHHQRFVTAHGLMRGLLSVYAGLAPAKLRIAHAANGKPRFADAELHAQLSFNLSHSGEEAVLAVSRGANLGVDVEVIRPLENLQALASSHFATGELKILKSLPVHRRHDGFFATWTRKEAYVKAIGAGLRVPLDSFEVAAHPDEPAALRSIDGNAASVQGWTLWSDRPTMDSWAALAVDMPQAAVKSFSLQHPST